MTCTRRLLLLAFLTLGLSSVSRDTSGQAYCALRDPVSDIYAAYPEADGFRSIVRTVDEDTRQAVSSIVPFTLHFNELGRHTLYVATTQEKPIGLVHVRSERGAWGLIEIAWILDLNLQVKGLNFQRCRSRARDTIESAEFVAQLQGKGYRQLLDFIDESGQNLVGMPDLTGEARDLAATVIRSGIKTLLVTEHSWAEPLEVIQSMGHAFAFFPESERAERLENVYTREALVGLEGHFGDSGTGTLIRESARGYRVLGADGSTHGHLFRLDWQSLHHEQTLWWAVTPDQVIQNVVPEGGWVSKEVESSFRFLKGMSYSDVSSCSTTSEAVAAEILIVSGAHD